MNACLLIVVNVWNVRRITECVCHDLENHHDRGTYHLPANDICNWPWSTRCIRQTCTPVKVTWWFGRRMKDHPGPHASPSHAELNTLESFPYLCDASRMLRTLLAGETVGYLSAREAIDIQMAIHILQSLLNRHPNRVSSSVESLVMEFYHMLTGIQKGIADLRLQVIV